MSQRPRAICFTLNNWSEPERVSIIANQSEFVYLIFQPEVGSNGTPHLQGYACRANPTTFKKWKELLGTRIHWEIARGTAVQNREYCSKVESRAGDLFEHGVLPQQGERSDLRAIVEAAKDQSNSLRDIVDVDAMAFVQHYRGIERLRSVISSPRDFETRCFWFYGATGLGKTRSALEFAPSAYWKQPNSSWWCGYDPSEHVDIIIDEYRAEMCPWSELLRICDRYPLLLPVKGGHVNFRAKRIFITSPYGPEKTWEGKTSEAFSQLLRRLTCIVEFTVLGKVFKKGRESDIGAGSGTPEIAVVGDVGEAQATHQAGGGGGDGSGNEPSTGGACVPTFNV